MGFMKEVKDKELQKYAFVLLKYEYEKWVKYNNSEQAKYAEMCGIDTYRSRTFMEELLVCSFPYAFSSEETAMELIAFAEDAHKNGDDFISTLIIAQIDQAENPVKMAKDWAEAQLKGSDSR